MSSRLLTQSRLRAARACQRLHHIQFELGYRPVVEADALRFGSLVHVGEEEWWTLAQAGIGGDERLKRTMDRLYKEEADLFDMARADALLTGYHHRWLDEPYEVLGVEVPFETELRNPATGQPSRTWRLAGKIDALVRDPRDGKVYVVEHKTSSEDISQGSAYWKRLRMDLQVSVYFEGARSLGLDVAGCLYDVLGKPQLRPLKANSKRAVDETPAEFHARCLAALGEEPERYFQRGAVVRLEEEMADALHDIWQLGQQIREAELAKRAPRNPDSCMRYNRPCPFFEVCSGAASLDDPTQFAKSEDVHPELMPKEAA